MATQVERRNATRRAIIVATHRLIQRTGADGITTDAVASQAGLSRSALYHYFRSTDEVVAALYDDVSSLAVRIASGHSGDVADPVDRLLARCNAWLDAVRRPDIGSVLLEAGPQILGWHRCREIENHHALPALTAAIGDLTKKGLLAPPSPDLLARILNAVIGELALDQTNPRDAAAALATIVNAYRPTGSVPNR